MTREELREAVGDKIAAGHCLDKSAAEIADAAIALCMDAAASVIEEAVNAPIVLLMENGEWITGNSPLKVRTFYRTITLADLVNISA